MSQEEYQVERWTLVKGNERKFVLELDLRRSSHTFIDSYTAELIRAYITVGYHLERALITRQVKKGKQGKWETSIESRVEQE